MTPEPRSVEEAARESLALADEAALMSFTGDRPDVDADTYLRDVGYWQDTCRALIALLPELDRLRGFEEAAGEVERMAFRQYLDWSHFHELAMANPFHAEVEAQGFARRVSSLLTLARETDVEALAETVRKGIAEPHRANNRYEYGEARRALTALLQRIETLTARVEAAEGAIAVFKEQADLAEAALERTHADQDAAMEYTAQLEAQVETLEREET